MPDFPLFPLVELQAAASAGNQWVALTLRVDAGAEEQGAAWHALFDPPATPATPATPDLLAALAPLDCVLLIPTPAVLTPALLALMPPNRVLFAIDAAVLADDAARRAMAALQDAGYRILLDGAVPAGVTVPPALRAVCRDCSDAAPAPAALLALFGPHLARGVHSAARFDACAKAGFSWFSGDYPIHPAPSEQPDDGSSRKRMLNLLGLLLTDADTCDIEAMLKQDPTLSYHLLKLANSAAFGAAAPITSFAQAIGRLGRRQLQRWLQLLLYARQREDGLANPLLPMAALRAAQMESLCAQLGGDRDAQDLAFMIGVFSLLDVLLAVSMDDIVAALKLPPDDAAALTCRGGPLGRMLALVETAAPTPAAIGAAGIASAQWWHSQLHAYHWAIQVSRNV